MKTGSMITNVQQIKTELIRRAHVVNEASNALLVRQAALTGTSPDPRRNLDKECGYPEAVTLDQLIKMHRREGVAARVVSIYPDECFAVDPDIYENEKKRNTPFEKAWLKLCESDSANPLHYMHRVDVMSGIGRYGGLLIGTDDGATDLSVPLPGMDDYGRPVQRKRDLKLNYLRAFDESTMQVSKIDMRMESPRLGYPMFYTMMFQDIGTDGTVSSSAAKDMHVHWSRVVHVADNRFGSEITGAPRQEPVFDKIMDVHKILGSSAEMLYKGGFPGLSVELDPRVLEAMNLDIDEASVKQEMFNYMNGLQRYLLLIGMNAKPLTAQVADPTPHLMCQLNAIAMSIGVPLRIFMGSEQAQLASGQDVRTWNRRLRKRQEKYLTPMLVRPLVDRFIALGILPTPKDNSYKVFWPDVNLPNEDERSTIADRRASSMMKYMTSGANKMMQPSDFYRYVWGMTQEQVAEVMANILAKPEIVFPELNAPKPVSSGTKGKSPSKPPKGGKVT